MSKDFSSLKVTELKEILKERGLASSGLKADLLERLVKSEKKPKKVEIQPKNVKPKIPKPATKVQEIEKKSATLPTVKAIIKSVEPSLQEKFNAFDDELMEFFGDTETYSAIRDRIIEESNNDIVKCEHKNCFDVDGINICKDCGCEVEKLDFQPEWRYYGAADSRSSKDPSRCHRSTESTRGGIDKVFQDTGLMYLHQSVRKKAEEKYKKIVGNETVRGRKRKSIVAACLLYTFRDDGDVRTADEVRKMFTGITGSRDVLSKQEMSDGLRRYHSVFKEDRTQCVKPFHLIKRTMHRTKINFVHYKYILRIAKCLEGVDPVLNRSSPQSVASAIVYLYLCLNHSLKTSLGLTKTKFAKEVELSDITISKLVKKTAEILGLQIEL